MIKSLRFHHIGILTTTLEKAVTAYEELGFVCKDMPEDIPSQKVKVCFMYKRGSPLIELIEPSGEDSPLTRFLDKHGPGPYHLCYSCDNLKETLSLLRKSRYQIISPPDDTPAASIASRVFVYKKELGLMELVETTGK